MIKDVIVRNAGKKGKGVFALKDFKKGNFIFRSKRGGIVSRKDLTKLSHDELLHLNELDKDKFEILQSTRRFLNHSCNPNAIVKSCSVFALKSIKKGDEIIVDYRVNGLFHNKWRCYCGSKNCSKWVISDFFTLPGKLQRKYLPYTIPYIRKEYYKRHDLMH